MFKLSVQPPARDDLVAMLAQGGVAKQSATRILVFLQELKVRQDWLGELLSRKFRNEEFNVDRYVTFWDEGLDMWRLALYEFDFTRQKEWKLPYRILYGYDQPCATFRILGVVSRDFDYEPDHEFTKRIRRTYDDLAMPKHHVRGATYGRAGNKRH